MEQRERIILQDMFSAFYLSGNILSLLWHKITQESTYKGSKREVEIT
jgi:hypothetical protein